MGGWVGCGGGRWDEELVVEGEAEGESWTRDMEVEMLGGGREEALLLVVVLVGGRSGSESRSESGVSV